MNIEEKSLLAEEYHRYLEIVTLISVGSLVQDKLSSGNLIEATTNARALLFAQDYLKKGGNEEVKALPNFYSFCESIRSLLGEELYAAEIQAILKEI